MIKKTLIFLAILVSILIAALGYLRYSHGTLGAKVTSKIIGEKWPLVVDFGYVNCENDILYFQISGINYALTEEAERHGYRNIDSLVRITEGDKKMSLDPLIERAKRVCY